MQLFKFLGGTTLLVILVLSAIAFEDGTNEIELPDVTIATCQSKEILVDKKTTELYRVRQLQLALKSYFDKAITSGDIVGAGVSIIKGDSIVITEGFGKRNIQGKAKVDGETVFRLGSLSKGFAGVLFAGLEAEGQLKFRDRVIDYLPQFQFGDEANTKQIQLSHILSHSSGAPYHSFTNLVEAGLPMEKIAARFSEVIPQSEPRRQYSYQNAMFALSQEVIHEATGKEVKTLLNNKFFNPLGMCNTSMDHMALLEEKNVAMPHVRNRKGWQTQPLRDRYYNAIVAGGINASSSDMAKWMHFLLGHRPEVMSKTTIEKAFQPYIEIKFNNKYYQRWPNYVKSHYGFGWRIHEFQADDVENTMTVYHHGGSVDNYRNEIALFPESDLGICVLLNANSKLAEDLIPDLYMIVQTVYDKTL